MSDVSYLMLIFKLAIFIVVAFVFKILYEFIYLPLRTRMKYRSYKNVQMTQKYYPFLGDVALITNNVKEKKGKFHHFIEEALQNKGIDLRVNQLASFSIFDVCSVKALDQFEKLVPSKIDRSVTFGFPLHNIIGGSLGASFSDEKWTKRRKEMTKHIGINFCSKHIPMMIKTIDKNIEESPLNEEISLTSLLTNTTFDIITKIFFGQDITEKMDKIEYQDPSTGKKSMLKFQEFYPKVAIDQFEGFYNPIGKFFPFLATYNLIDPYKTNAKNKKAYYDALVNFLDNSMDKDSVYYALYSSGNFTKEECIMDTLLMLFAGFDTSSRGLSSIVCMLKKAPEKLDKLMKELEKHEITNIMNLPQDQYKSKYEECDYLNYVAKEGLRYDPPAVFSIPYVALEDCEIANVKIPKGHKIEVNTVYSHYNPEQWHRPDEFIPERFDPESELFFKPGTKELRHPKSYIPFSFGPRNCLGQTLAKLELKVILSRFVSKVEYEINEELMINDYRYNVIDGKHLYGKITSKKSD